MNVHVGSRDPECGQRAVDEIGGTARLLVLDVTDADSIADAARQVEALDILVNNAGVSLDTASARRDVSSGAASLAWSTAWSTGPNPQFTPGSGTGAAYRSSKTALNAATVFYALEYALELAEAGVKVNALAPGLRATDLNAFAAASGRDPAQAAAGAVRLALLPDDGPTGGFFSWDGTRVLW